jgi:hypothetical protein
MTKRHRPAEHRDRRDEAWVEPVDHYPSVSRPMTANEVISESRWYPENDNGRRITSVTPAAIDPAS